MLTTKSGLPPSQPFGATGEQNTSRGVPRATGTTETPTTVYWPSTSQTIRGQFPGDRQQADAPSGGARRRMGNQPVVAPPHLNQFGTSTRLDTTVSRVPRRGAMGPLITTRIAPPSSHPVRGHAESAHQSSRAPTAGGHQGIANHASGAPRHPF
jgi:hypothetical protein